MDEQTLAMMRCPVTGSRLRLDARGAWLISETGGLRYPIRDGIPGLLEEEAQLPDGVASMEEFKKRFLAAKN